MQKRADDFEDLVRCFLKSVGYTQIKDEPKIGAKKADLLVTRGEARFIVEAKSPDLMRETFRDPDHEAQVMQFERHVTRYVKKRFRTVHKNCIMTGSWDGLLGKQSAEKDIRKWLEPIEPWVGRENELPTQGDLRKWSGWIKRYESVKICLENHPKLDPEGVRIIKFQCPVYDEIPSYPYGKIPVSTTKPKKGKPREWHCTWRLLRRDRSHPETSGFTFIAGGGPAGSSHRIEHTVKKAIKEYKEKLKLAEVQYPELPCVPLVLFVDGRKASPTIDKGDLDTAFAGGVWKGEPSTIYPKTPLGVVMLGTPMRGGSQSDGDMFGDFIHNPHWGPSFPTVINPLLRTHRLRDWTVVKTLQQVEKI